LRYKSANQCTGLPPSETMKRFETYPQQVMRLFPKIEHVTSKSKSSDITFVPKPILIVISYHKKKNINSVQVQLN